MTTLQESSTMFGRHFAQVQGVLYALFISATLGVILSLRVSGAMAASTDDMQFNCTQEVSNLDDKIETNGLSCTVLQEVYDLATDIRCDDATISWDRIKLRICEEHDTLECSVIGDCTDSESESDADANKTSDNASYRTIPILVIASTVVLFITAH